MKKLLLISLLCGILFPCMAQKNIIKNKDNQSMKTIRLIYPQWQGAKITHLIPELKDNPNDASMGYYLGAQLLNYLAPNTNQETFTVPVSMEMTDREITDGVTDRDALLNRPKLHWECSTLSVRIRL